jgi:hypothetical protein
MLGVAMVVFLFSVIRSVVHSRIWRWRSMSRIRLLILVIGLAWHFRSAVRELRSSPRTGWRHARSDRGWGRALRNSLDASRLPRAISTASATAAHRRGSEAVEAVDDGVDGELHESAVD